jgi:hypothetical protein
LAGAIREGISCPQKYRQLCSNAIERVNKFFTWDFVASEAHALYMKTTAQKYLRPVYLLQLRRPDMKRLRYDQANASWYAAS